MSDTLGPLPNKHSVCGLLLEKLKEADGYEASRANLVAHIGDVLGLPGNSDSLNGYFQDAVTLMEPFVHCDGDVVRLANVGRQRSGRRETYFEERKGLDTEEKQAVAAYIHDELLKELDAIFMDAGSACEAIAWEMALGDKGHFTVMTNNMRAVRAFLTRPSIRVRITGGTYVVDDEALVGDGAVFDPDEYSVRHAIVGASGITATHVYNHGITGEEFIKRVYWQTPAQLLIVPATLRKFGGKDACCFGELFKEKDAVQIGEETVNVYDVLHDTIEEARFSRRKKSQAFSLHRHVPRFTATNCKIIIGPKWLIERNYREDERNALQQVVDEINHGSTTSCVEVVHAKIGTERLDASMRRLAAVDRSRL